MEETVSGEWFISRTKFGPLVHVRMGIAQKNSGKLVSLVRQKAKELAGRQKSDWVIIDGPPGIGCPVIAALSGIDHALVVTEPTFSGFHDAGRVIEVARHFQVPVSLMINKYDLNLEVAGKIEAYCESNGIPCLSKIKFDKNFVKAMVAGRTIIECAAGESSDAIRAIWEKILWDG